MTLRARLEVIWSATAAMLAAVVAGLTIQTGALFIVPAAAALAFIAEPTILALGYAAVRGFLPDTTILTVVFVSGGTAYLIARGGFHGPKLLTYPLAAYVALAILTTPIEQAPWDRAQPDYMLPGGFVFLPFTTFEAIEAVRLYGLLLALLVGGAALGTIRDTHRLLRVVLAGALAPIGIGILQLVTGDTVERDGVAAIVGPFFHANAFAVYLLVIIAFAVGGLASHRRGSIDWWLAGTALGGATICLYGTYTRSAWIGAALIAVFFGVTRYRGRVGIAVAAIAVGIALAPGLTAGATDRFATLMSSASRGESSWDWRTRQWEIMLPVAMESPIIGTGFATYERETVKEFGTGGREGYNLRPVEGYKRGFSAHNDFIKSFLELGVLGLALWVAVFVALYRVAWRWRNHPELGSIALSICAVTLALALASISDNIQGYGLPLALSLMMIGALDRAASLARR